MRYILNKESFRTAMMRAGYESILDFSRKTSIHRSTILGYLSGKNIFLSSFYEISKWLSVDPLKLVIAISETDAKIPNIDEIVPLVADIVRFDENISVILLGSRAKGNSKKYSDWDIGITRGIKPLTGEEYLKLKGRIDDLSEDIPRLVDLVNLDDAPRWFLTSIDYEPVFLDGNRESYLYFKGVLDGIRKRE